MSLLFLLCLWGGFSSPAFWNPSYLEAALAPPVKLSGPLMAGGTVVGMDLSPDGAYLVFRGDKEILGVTELYSIHLATGTIAKLSQTLPTGAEVYGYLISPTSDRVVYQIITAASGRALFSVPIGGGTVANISDVSAAPSDKSIHYEITPDGQTVVFRSNIFGLYRVFRSPMSGVSVSEPPFELDKPINAQGEVTSARLSPDGSRVVYKADAVTVDQVDLFTVPLSGVGAFRITNLGPNWDINQFWFTPDNSRIVYTTFGGGNSQLFSVPLTGGTPTRLDNPSGSKYYIGSVYIASNSDWVVYTGQQTSDKYELFSVPVVGPSTESRKLNPDLPPFADLNGPGDTGFVALSPDGSRVIYNADLEVDEQFNLYQVPIAGPAGDRVQVNPPFSTGNGVTGGGYHCSGEWIKFHLQSGSSFLSESFLIPVTLDRPARSLTAGFVSQGDYLQQLYDSPDCRRMIMVIQTGPMAETEGYLVLPQSGEPVRFHPAWLDPPGGSAR